MIKNHKQLINILKVKPHMASGMIVIELANCDWQKAADHASKLEYRLVTIWAEDRTSNLELNIILAIQTKYLQLKTIINIASPIIPSFTPYFPSANRLERHASDMFGIKFTNHPDPRPWTRHQAWTENDFPLRKSYVAGSKANKITPADTTYQFMQVSGAGVCEIPVGPVHAGIIEPGHFRFSVAGEDIIQLEERLGYKHKGIEKIAEGRTIDHLIKLAGRVSGDSTVAYAWSTCAAIENALDLLVPKRALAIRAIMCERERVANHLGDIAAICNDVSYTFPYYQLTRLKELWLRLNYEIFKHRLIMDNIVLGGVINDISSNDTQKISSQVSYFKNELNDLFEIIENHSGLYDRARTTGILTHEQAKKIGVLGYVGRASGIDLDLRRDLRYPPYDKLTIKVPTFTQGDVLARMLVRVYETLTSLDLISQLVADIPKSELSNQKFTLNQNIAGIGLIEGWRGEIVTFVRISANGIVERYFPRDPSWFSWPALELLIHGNIVPDFPVCNKSINASYSGVDL